MIVTDSSCLNFLLKVEGALFLMVRTAGISAKETYFQLIKDIV